MTARWRNDAKIIDVDGSFGAPDQNDAALKATGSNAGTAGSTIVTNWELYDNLGCDVQDNDLMNGGVEVVVCPNNMKLSRFGIYF